MSFGPKHQRKVNDCYPNQPGEEGAISGKISVLTYYINAKPEKLLKVSAYLEKKVKKDVMRERSGYNKITLDIVDGIMNDCSEYFSSFAISALLIIDTLSKTNDLELMVRFVKFSKLVKSILSSLRDEIFFKHLEDVESNLINLTLKEDISDSVINYCTLKGCEIDCIVASLGMEDFRAQGGMERLANIILAITRNFQNLDELNALSEDQLSDTHLKNLIFSFKSYVKGLTSSTLPLFMKVFFEITIKYEEKYSEAISIEYSILIKYVPAAFLCIFVSEIFRQIEKAQEPTLSVLVNSLSDLLLSNRGPLGYSALEIASNLLRILRRQRPSAPQNTRTSFLASSSQPPPKAVFSICDCLVSILRNNNFASQKYEIINHIISKAFLPRDTKNLIVSDIDSRRTPQQLTFADHHSLATVTLDNVEEVQFRAVTWSVLFAMAEEASPSTVAKLAFVEIPVKVFDSFFLMILNTEPEFRLNSLVLFNRLVTNGLSFVSSVHSAKQSNPRSLINSLPRNSQILFARFRVSVFKSLLLETNQTLHFCALDGLLKAVLRDADFTHAICSAVLVSSLHEYLDVLSLEQQIIILQLTYGYLKKIGDLLENSDLTEFCNDMLEKMKTRKIHVFNLVEGLDTSPPPLCIRTSEDPCVNDYKFSAEKLKKIFCSKRLSEEQQSIMDTCFSHYPYLPELDLESYKDMPRNEHGRRSLFPASPKKPLGSESASNTILAHRRSMFNVYPSNDGNNSLTVPGYSEQASSGKALMRNHQTNSSTSLVSQISRASSLQKKNFRSLNASYDTLPNDPQNNELSEDSVLEGDFADLTIRNREKSRESKDRSTSFLH